MIHHIPRIEAAHRGGQVLLRLRLAFLLAGLALLAGCWNAPTAPRPATSGNLPSIVPAPLASPSAGAQPADPPADSAPAVEPPETAGEGDRYGLFLPHVGKGAAPAATPSFEAANPPNLLIVLSDDQRFDTMEYMPLSQAQIFDQGTTFLRAYATTSSCCPSRASLLTGKYAHNHGVHLNQDPLEQPTFPEDLHAAGYFTGLVGKYLNSWNGAPRPEFDSWVSFEGGSSPYFDPRLNVQGEWMDLEGYMTYLLRDFALEFLDQALESGQPFFLLFAPTAPHEPSNPAPGDEDLYPDLPRHRPPSFNEEDVSDKPLWLQEYDPFSQERIRAVDELRRRQLQALNALDGSVASLLARLEEAGELDDTFVVYLSDNGYFWGEHRRYRGKGYAWEESIHIPFAIRYPPLAQPLRQDSHLVAVMDLAPTIYELAGLPAPPGMDGASLLPLLRGEDAWRDRLMIENWNRFGPYLGVRSERYLYVEWENDLPELYDTESDPYQLENRVNDPAYAAVVEEFRQFLEQARADQE